MTWREIVAMAVLGAIALGMVYYGQDQIAGVVAGGIMGWLAPRQPPSVPPAPLRKDSEP